MKKLIAELGLRYRPPLQADLEAHAHALGLLTQDVADMPESALHYAVTEWVRTKPFMPKANELIALARDHLEAKYAPRVVVSEQAWCDQRNATLMQRSQHPGEQIEWFVDANSKARLGWTDRVIPSGPPYCTPEEAKAILREHPSSFGRVMLAAIEQRDR